MQMLETSQCVVIKSVVRSWRLALAGIKRFQGDDCMRTEPQRA